MLLCVYNFISPLTLQENYRMGGSYKWPSVDEVVAYRKEVRQIILQIIQDTPLKLPVTMNSPWVIEDLEK